MPETTEYPFQFPNQLLNELTNASFHRTAYSSVSGDILNDDLDLALDSLPPLKLTRQNGCIFDSTGEDSLSL